MFKAILERRRQRHRTTKYPAEPALLPELFRGYPRLNQSLCPAGCQVCVDVCPTGAVCNLNGLTLDMGRCLFCPECIRACPSGAIAFERDEKLAWWQESDTMTLSRSRRMLSDQPEMS